LNTLSHLYAKDLGDKLYAAASHSDLTVNMTEQFNKLRLGNYEAESYYNSGVLLMNIDAIRQKVKATDIFNYISANRASLFLPDQVASIHNHQRLLHKRQVKTMHLLLVKSPRLQPRIRLTQLQLPLVKLAKLMAKLLPVMEQKQVPKMLSLSR